MSITIQQIQYAKITPIYNNVAMKGLWSPLNPSNLTNAILEGVVHSSQTQPGKLGTTTNYVL